MRVSQKQMKPTWQEDSDPLLSTPTLLHQITGVHVAGCSEKPFASSAELSLVLVFKLDKNRLVLCISP